MTKWTRAESDHLCGARGCHIRRGDPLFVIRLRGYDKDPIESEKYRCVDHAWGPCPPDLPELVERDHPLMSMAPARVVAKTLPLDFKRRQFKDREPGEDDV